MLFYSRHYSTNPHSNIQATDTVTRIVHSLKHGLRTYQKKKKKRNERENWNKSGKEQEKKRHRWNRTNRWPFHGHEDQGWKPLFYLKKQTKKEKKNWTKKKLKKKKKRKKERKITSLVFFGIYTYDVSTLGNFRSRFCFRFPFSVRLSHETPGAHPELARQPASIFVTCASGVCVDSSGIDNNPTVFYRLMPGSTAQTNKFHTFYLQQRAEKSVTWADIKVNHQLDYESIKEYNLTIRVEVREIIVTRVSL